jgi:hypothetical protein
LRHPYLVTRYGLQQPTRPFRMKAIALKFGSYQEPASIHNHAAGRFGELLTRKLDDRISFELIGRKKGNVLLISGKEFEL